MIILWNFDMTKGKGRQNFIRYNEFSLDRRLFFIWGKENSDTEDIVILKFVISSFHGNGSPSLMTKLNYHTRRNGHEKCKSKQINLIF